MNKEKSIITNMFHKNGRALGSMGYFILLMLVFLIGAPEAWMRPSLHQSVFVMLPTLIFLVIPLVFLVASGEIDLSFASTYAVAAYVFAIMVKTGIDPAIARAIYNNAELIILDEPTNALSLNETQKVFDFVKNVKKSNRSVLFIGHNIFHIYDISDRFVILDRGEVVHQLDKKDVSSPEKLMRIMKDTVSEH